MNTGNNQNPGNMLGGARAEVDRKMLDSAFIETPDFQALVSTRDFNFVVGRRGTGKSALYLKVSEYIQNKKIGLIYCKTPEEYETIELQAEISKLSQDYRCVRAITRVAWRVSILLDLSFSIIQHYKASRCETYNDLEEIVSNNKDLEGLDCFKRTTEIIKLCSTENPTPESIPGLIASSFRLQKIHDCISDILSELNTAAYFFFDGLDEGWVPNITATALIGGLAACASDFAEKQCQTHIVLFVRDNIYRSLSYFDRDFSRHIEGSTLRLNWDDESLLHLISSRLRHSLELESIESNIKVWNRFAYSDLKNKDGFKFCLNYTLYRPRDLIVLLNSAYTQTQRSGRSELIKNDIEVSSKQISSNRLNDLLKEYDTVFPGLSLFIDHFRGQSAQRNYKDVISSLNNLIQVSEFNDFESSDFAIIETGEDAFFALYSVGFLGIENPTTRNLQFCHDGSSADIDATKLDQETCIHPCYWKALDINSEFVEENVLIEVHDDEGSVSVEKVADLRTKKIGQLVSALPNMDEGKENASDFENWVYRAIKILFSGKLSNPELHPNKDAIQRRDVVSTNMAKEGFWNRVREDYKCRQVVFEIKNYSKLKIDDIRQAHSYSGEPYGRFIIIITRNQNEGLSNTEKGWVKEFWDLHNVVIFVLPAMILSRCISKLRSRQRFDYADDQLNKRLDTFLRSYLSLKHIKGSQKRKKKK